MIVWAVVPLGVVAVCYAYWRCYGIATAVPFRKEVAGQPGRGAALSADGAGLELSSLGGTPPAPAAREAVASPGGADALHHTTALQTTGSGPPPPASLIASRASRFRADVLKKLKARRPTPKDHFMVSTVILLYLRYPCLLYTSPSPRDRG